MLAAPQHGFVFLAAAKGASTSMQRALRRHAQLVTQSPPSLKHMSAREFETFVAPLLAAHGFPRSDYETTCLLRHPVDLTVSWWRYRSRPSVAGLPQYTGDLSFDDFARLVVDGRGGFPRPAEWSGGEDGHCLIDRPFRYESIDACVRWLEDKIGAPLKLGRANVSPSREVEMSPGTRAMLEEHFAAEVDLYDSAR